MKILVNGSWREVSSERLAGALEEIGYGGAVVATAVNGEFVPVRARSEKPLYEGDQLEVLAPMQGG
jgi:sulfur carrier protein